nr:MAG TPA: hypothetical protein [Caudoviricetes sp.]
MGDITSLFDLTGRTGVVGRSIVPKAIIRSLSYVDFDRSRELEVVRLINRLDSFQSLVIQGKDVYRIANDREFGVVKQIPTITSYTDELGVQRGLSGDYKLATRPYEQIAGNLALIDASFDAMGRKFDLDGSVKFIAKTKQDLNLKVALPWQKQRNSQINASVEAGDKVLWFKDTEDVKELQPDYSSANMNAPRELLTAMLAQSGIPPEFVLGMANDNQTMTFINQITGSYLDALGIDWTFDFSTTLSFISTAGYKYLDQFNEVTRENERFTAELEILKDEKVKANGMKYQVPAKEKENTKKGLDNGNSE